MLNRTGIKTETYNNINQILFAVQHQVSVGVLVDDTDVIADASGKKIIKAGTPVTGDLEKRELPFSKSATNVQGVLLHDVDVTVGEENGTLLLFGFVNLNRLDEETRALITSDVKEQLNMIKFISA